MDTNTEKFIKAFKEVKEKGYLLSHRSGNTGIGKTLEDYIGVEENNLDAPDLHGFEIKSQRAFSESKVTLFTKSPTWPQAANTMLRENYGTPDKRRPDMPVLHTSMYHSKFNNHKSGYGFKLERSDADERIYLQVQSSSGALEPNEIYWSYEVIKKVFRDKLKNLAFVTASTNKTGGVEYFHFEKCVLFHDASFEKFLDALVDDLIQFDIRIGVYRQGRNEGKTHDHGSGFRISKNNMEKIFGLKVEI